MPSWIQGFHWGEKREYQNMKILSPAMSEVNSKSQSEQLEEKGHSLWSDAWKQIKKDRFALLSLLIITFFAVLALLAKFGFVAAGWQEAVGPSYAPPFWLAEDGVGLFGTDIFGRSVLDKVIHGSRIAMSVGIVVNLIAIPIGVLLGGLAGYFGGWVDDLVVWLYTTVSSIPSIVLLIAVSFVFKQSEMFQGENTIFGVYLALSMTAWVGLCRLIRGEFLKHKNRDYVQAAKALGATHTSRFFKHILPNVTHIIIINASLTFQSVIKAEVILSYLGLGVQGQPSWGIMIDDAKMELARDVWWQLAGATFAMFLLVLAFNIFGDALRDALDPKVRDK
jgi:peptide/nickel transport system permease protein